jgi:hypothetical protein
MMKVGLCSNAASNMKADGTITQELSSYEPLAAVYLVNAINPSGDSYASWVTRLWQAQRERLYKFKTTYHYGHTDVKFGLAACQVTSVQLYMITAM